MVALAPDVCDLFDTAPGAETHDAGCSAFFAARTGVDQPANQDPQRGCTAYGCDFTETCLETGLYYARRRMYSPTLGRFVSRDPAKYINGLSMYRAYFSPNRLDPSGKWCDSDCSTAGAKSDYAVDDIDVVRAAAGNIPPGVVRVQGGDLIGAIERFNNVQNIANIAVGATQGLADAATAAADSGADSFFGGNENLGAGGSATEGVVDRLDGIFNDVPPGQAMMIWVHVKWKICTHHWCCWPIWDKLTKDDGGGAWYRFPEFGIEGIPNDSNRGNAIRDAAVNAIQKATAP